MFEVKTVLVVEDDASIRKFIVQLFEDRDDYQVIGEAYDGDEAMDLYRLHKPDVVFMDLRMPKFDGFTALDDILEYNPEAKVIVMSAMNDAPVIVDIIQKGAVNFITKPFDEEDVFAALDKLW